MQRTVAVAREFNQAQSFAVGLAGNLGNAFARVAVEGGKINEELKQMVKQLAGRALAGLFGAAVGSFFGPGGAAAGFKMGGGFASGGSFTVPGAGSSFDTQNVQFKARPGELVTVTPKGQSSGRSNTFNLNISAQSIDRQFVDNELIPMLDRAGRRFA